jgi:chromate transporter
LGYIRDELVIRRKWIDEAGYAGLVALCQFLPGPASRQVGFALGLLRAGPLGALAAWTAFTLPSAFLLVVLAMTATAFIGPVGLMFCRSGETVGTSELAFRVPRWVGVMSLVAFFALLALLPLVASSGLPGTSLFDAFYRSGALVFGGGHVVLPLLQAEVVDPGWVSVDAFLAGYGITQAMPGPLFTFAAYLGAVVGPEPNGLAGAGIALVAVFLSGFLLLLGALPFWAAALYSPVWTSAVMRPYDFALATTGFLLLTVWKAPPWPVVVTMSIARMGLALL